MRNKVVAALGITAVCASQAMAATDITSAIDEIGGYKTAAMVIGVALFLFTVGRKVARKLF